MPQHTARRPRASAPAAPSPAGVLVVRHLPCQRPDVWQAPRWEDVANQLQVPGGLAPYRDLLDASSLSTRWGGDIPEEEARILGAHGSVAECSGEPGHSYSCPPNEAPSLKELILHWLRWDVPLELVAFESDLEYASWRANRPLDDLVAAVADPVAAGLGWRRPETIHPASHDPTDRSTHATNG